MSYIPKPIETKNIDLPEYLEPLIEMLAEHNHDIWAQERMKTGWTYGPQRDDNTKKHPDLVAYNDLPEGEKAKSERELFRLYHSLIRRGFERQDTVLALGGGVTGDLAGYAAASFLRGVRFVNVATTRLAQVDSAIGGKTAINLGEGKNLIGAFYPPKLVISDVGVLKTLPPRQLYASLAEVAVRL